MDPPHSSHMGGVWERMIGVTWQIINSMLKIFTLMADNCAIINGQPFVQVTVHTCSIDIKLNIVSSEGSL